MVFCCASIDAPFVESLRAKQALQVKRGVPKRGKVKASVKREQIRQVQGITHINRYRPQCARVVC